VAPISIEDDELTIHDCKITTLNTHCIIDLDTEDNLSENCHSMDLDPENYRSVDFRHLGFYKDSRTSLHPITEEI